jgi:nucleotide-binding universal stress UspA family protein
VTATRWRDAGPILVALDGSELAEGVLPYARALAGAMKAPLVLATVWEGAERDLGETFPAMATEIGEAAQQHFSEYLGRIKGRIAGGEVETIVRPGDASEELPRIAEETGARIVAIATHGRSGIGRWLYGSTASHLIRHSPVPLLVAGPHALGRKGEAVIKHVGVPLDGSELSEAAVEPAISVARALGARISLVRAVKLASQSYPYTLPDAYFPQLDEELERAAKDYLRGVEERISGVERDAFVVRGFVAEGLMDFVEKQRIDLLVMTTHGRAGLVRMALGSLADRMLHGGAPVLLIRPE